MKGKIFRLSFFIPAILLAFGTTVPAAENSDSTMNEEIKALKKMVLELQKRVRELEADRVEPGGPGAPHAVKKAEPRPKKEAPAKTSHPEQKTDRKAPLEDEQPVKAKAGVKAPAPLAIGGRRVSVGIDGSIQVDAIHDFNAMGLSPDEGLQREFVTSLIPVGGQASQRKNRTGLSPNASSLSAWAETPTPWGPFKAYAEVNLFGSSTDTEFQIYKVYGKWGWLKAGLDYSIWLNQPTMPDTLDFEGPNAIPEARLNQASLKIPLTPAEPEPYLYVTLGIEDAEGELTLPTTEPGAHSTNQFPSVVGKLTYRTQPLLVELGGLYRRLKAEGPSYDQSVNGWGVMLSGKLDTWKDDNVIFGVLYGEGIGAYIDDTQGLGLDAAPRSATDSHLKAIPAFGLWAAYKHWWSESLRSTAAYGYVSLDNQFDEVPKPQGTFHRTHYASLNIIWSPWSPFDIGLEYLFGHRTVTDHTAVEGSTTGHDHRIQCTARWNFAWNR